MGKRANELKSIFEKLDDSIKTIVRPLFNETEFIEKQLANLKKQPFIKYHPKDPTIQKQTPAGKLYKDLLAQEKDIVRILCSQLHKQEGEDESPLREYLKELKTSD